MDSIRNGKIPVSADVQNKLDGGCQNAVLAIGLLQGKWKMQILCAMRVAPVRLGQLARLIPLASKKVLTENLRALESSGVVARREFSGTVRHVEYDFSENMRPAICSILDRLTELGSFREK
jgi:DNA-binding HxlR family transcriptional regulator